MAPVAKPSSGKGKEVIDRLTAQALRALQDPNVGEKIVKQGRAVMDSAQRWRTNRQKTGDRSVTDRVAESVGGRFGQRGLERREANLRAAVSSLVADSPELETSLRPLVQSLDDVARLLKVSAALPFAKRKRAHMKIDGVLDELEAGFFDAVLEGSRPAEIED